LIDADGTGHQLVQQGQEQFLQHGTLLAVQGDLALRLGGNGSGSESMVPVFRLYLPSDAGVRGGRAYGDRIAAH